MRSFPIPEQTGHIRCALAVAGLGLCASVLAEPFPVTDLSPVARIFAPPAATSAAIPDAHGMTFDMSVDWASFANLATEPGELLVLDGESVTVTGRWQFVNRGWRFGLDVPLVYQSGGVLDGFIDGYHDLLNLPEGSRPQLGKDELIYVYEREGQRLLDVRGHSSGIADSVAHVSRQWFETGESVVSWRAHLKLPTGSSDRVLGSGTLGVGASLHGATRRSWRERELEYFGGAGLQWHDGSDVLSEIHRSTVWWAYGGAQWAMNKTVTLRAQFDAHGKYYNSAARGLERVVQVTVGGDVHLASGWTLRIGVFEDILVRSAPDVVFHFGLHRSQ